MSEEVKDEEMKVKDAEKKEQTGTMEVERLRMVSEAVRALGVMSGMGISWCIVKPGEENDSRLASWTFAKDTDKPEQVVKELSGNVSCMLQSLMEIMRKNGLEERVILELADAIGADAKEKFLKNRL